MLKLPLFALLFCGFSVFAALLLASLVCRFGEFGINPSMRCAAYSLLVNLAGLQIAHFYYLDSIADYVHSRFYVALLFGVAPAFYFLNGHAPVTRAHCSIRPTHPRVFD